MSIGIMGTGVYIPYYYIKRETISSQWETAPAKGERSLCNADEDSVTMAAEAAINCLSCTGRDNVEALYYASTTAPYAEKSHASILAKVCDLANSTQIADFLASKRAGMSAVKSAYNAVKAGESKCVLVTGADMRNGYPKSQTELYSGDAAAALMLGSENVAAEIVGFETVNVEIHDEWRNVKDDYVRMGEGRFIKSKGYTYALVAAVKKLMKLNGLAIGDVARIIIPSSNLKEHMGVARALGFAPGKVQDPMIMNIGDCGAAHPLLLLAAALESANAGDLIIWTAYGSGADAVLLKVTDRISALKNRGMLARYLLRRKEITGYSRFLSFRGLIQAEPGEPFKISPSGANYWRDQNCILSLHGSKCRKCGQIMFPINRVCYSCHSKDEFDEIRLYDRIFKLFTYSVDRLAGRSDDPVIGQAVAEDSDGTRIYLLITDFMEADIVIGMPLEPTLRKMHNLGDFVNYYWKLRPLRKEEV